MRGAASQVHAAPFHAALLRACRRKQLAEYMYTSASCFNPGVTNPASPLFGRCTGQRLKGAMPRAKGVTMPKAKKSKVDGGGVLVAGLASFPLSRRLRSRRPRHLTSWQANRVHQRLQNRPTLSLTRRPWKCLRLRPSLRRGSPHPPLFHRATAAHRYRATRSHRESFGRAA